MTDEERGRAWWDEQVIRAATTDVCVDGPWEALSKLLSERDALQRECKLLAKVYEHAAYVSRALREEYRYDTVNVTMPAKTWDAFKAALRGGGGA